ncbi:unnamed protein product, partial [marine sediment metagenome]
MAVIPIGAAAQPRRYIQEEEIKGKKIRMQYQIKKPKKLTDTEITDINNIVSTCNKHDSLNYTFDQTDDFKKDSNINTFLLYDKNTLLSVITLFVPRKNEAEVAAFTLPEFRREGLFS